MPCDTENTATSPSDKPASTTYEFCKKDSRSPSRFFTSLQHESFQSQRLWLPLTILPLHWSPPPDHSVITATQKVTTEKLLQSHTPLTHYYLSLYWQGRTDGPGSLPRRLTNSSWSTFRDRHCDPRNPAVETRLISKEEESYCCQCR